MIYIKRYESIFSSSDDDLASQIYKRLKSSISNKEIVSDLQKFANYKRSVKIKAKDNTYDLAIQKSSNDDNFVFILNNKHYVNKNGKSTVSKSICRNIWNLLDDSYNKNYYNKDVIKKDFK